MSFIERAKDFIGKAAPIATRVGLAGGLTLATASAASVARADSEVGLVPQGNVLLTITLDETKVVVVRTQILDAAGLTFSVDPQNHPDATIVAAFYANKPVVIPVSVRANMASGVHISDISVASHEQRLAELGRVIQEQSQRSFSAGECGLSTGCSNVRTLGFGVKKDEKTELLTYEPAGDATVINDKSVAVAPDIVPSESVTAPKYPDNLDQAVSNFGGNAGEWKKNNSGAWHFDSPNKAVSISPRGFIMDGYDQDGPFVASGNVLVNALGATVWPVSGSEEAAKLLKAVQANNQNKQIRRIGF